MGMSSDLTLTDLTKTLCEIKIDNIDFKVTRHSLDEYSCILWIRDNQVCDRYEALGKFSRFDKRDIIFFVGRYTTSPELRELIEIKRFEKRISGLKPAFFQNLVEMCMEDRLKMYRELYNLEDVINRKEIRKKYRIMARRFHPDSGGDHISMAIINEAYKYLSEKAVD